ncbi:MFS transporter [Kutzneria buriramensis]|uniref:ACS family tartrate transporter-like MFS transporter n=1 Tax=Kutzneria buriramensis TaxID=1045776 RepID=A0A3E0H2F6_9PSEU|nr:MFS transporter [Kutzneria buriramensis]REH36162.1 ACS family tartrate transporter-like MFS transporter [Kutzneria buriramensis]
MITSEVGERALARATWRLVPLMAVCYFFAYLDRTNLAVAALTMNRQLGLSATAYGFGAGLLFVGYVLLDAPSNLVLHRVGARVWMARIMVVWGIVAAACAAIQGEVSFYVLRFLLGVAEAGFFPGMILYLSYWFPAARRATVTGLFMIAVPLSTAIGAPLGGLLLGLDGTFGLAGWRWLFLVEGLPSIVLGALLLWLLPDRPADARWLSADERAWITDTVAAEEAAVPAMPVRRAVLHPRVIALGLVYFAIAFGLYGLGFWMPTILKTSLAIKDNLTVTLLTAVPYAIGAIAMVWWGRRCDRIGRPVPHTLVPMAAGGVLLAVTAFLTTAPWLGYLGLCACAIGVMAAFPCFWTLPSAFLSGAAVAAGIGVINSIGNLSGFLGPYWVGWMTDLFGSATWGLVTIGLVMVAGAGLVSRLRTAA